MTQAVLANKRFQVNEILTTGESYRFSAYGGLPEACKSVQDRYDLLRHRKSRAVKKITLTDLKKDKIIYTIRLK